MHVVWQAHYMRHVDSERRYAKTQLSAQHTTFDFGRKSRRFAFDVQAHFWRKPQKSYVFKLTDQQI